MNELKRKVSVFKGVRTINPGGIVSINNLLDNIKDGVWQEKIARLRKFVEVNPEAYRNEKEILPAATFSGQFTIRRTNALVEHSGIIVLDIDWKENQKIELTWLRHQMAREKWVSFFFISPSGRGLKVGVVIDGKKHLKSFLSLEKYMKTKYDVIIDPSAKDITRLCFVSYDPHLYRNEHAIRYEVDDDEFPSSAYPRGKEGWTSGEVEELLKKIPPRPDYDMWIRIVSAVGSIENINDAEKIRLLRQWSPEEKPNEYAYQLKHRLEKITMGTLIHYAGKRGNVKQINQEQVKEAKEIIANEKKRINQERQNQRMEAILFFLSRNFRFRRNLITEQIEWTRLKSIIDAEKEERDLETKAEWVAWSDVQANNIWLALMTRGVHVNRRWIDDLVETDHVSPPYDPFRAYFEALPEWDGKDEVKALFDCLTLDDQMEYEESFRIWLRGLVAGAYDCQPNQVFLIFQGRQGIYKTMFLRNLVPKRLMRYLYIGPIRDDKDSMIYITRSFLIMDDELDSVNWKTVNSVKRFLSQREVLFRRPYAKYAKTYLRRASLCGSVNGVDFLFDGTGNRRFLVFPIQKIDMDRVKKIDMDRVYAQVFYEYLDGKKFFFAGNDEIAICKQAEKFEHITTEYGWMARVCSPEDNGTRGVWMTASELMVILMEIIKRKHLVQQNLSLRLIGVAASKMGFQKRRDTRKREILVYFNPEYYQVDKGS